MGGSGGAGPGGRAEIAAGAPGAAGETECSAAGASASCEQASVDASGRDIVSADGMLTLSIPEGALDAAVTVTIQTLAGDVEGAVGNLYELEPEGLTFKKPVAVTIRTPAAASVGDFRRLRVANLVSDVWQPLAVEWLEYNGPSIGGLTTHFSKYALTAEAEPAACQCAPENKTCCTAGSFDEATCSCSISGYYDDPSSCSLWWSKNYDFVWKDQDCLAQKIDWNMTACSEDWRQCCREAGGVGPLFNGMTSDSLVVAPEAQRCVCDLGCGDSKTAEASFLGCVRQKAADGKTLANPDAICGPPNGPGGAGGAENDNGAAGSGGSADMASSGGTRSSGGGNGGTGGGSHNGTGGAQNTGSGGSGGGPSTGGSGGAPPTCSNGLQPCTDPDTGVTTCLDLISNVDHCGTCDNACGAGNHCSQGICCAPQEEACADGGGEECFDLSQSNDHCGTCLHACAENEACADGACTCEYPFESCAGQCIDVEGDDAENCGDCGVHCDQPPSPTCVNSTTLRTASANGTCESGICTYPTSDSACPADETCWDGACVPGGWYCRQPVSGWSCYCNQGTLDGYPPTCTPDPSLFCCVRGYLTDPIYCGCIDAQTLASTGHATCQEYADATNQMYGAGTLAVVSMCPPTAE
jgi:hypothetical protein